MTLLKQKYFFTVFSVSLLMAVAVVSFAQIKLTGRSITTRDGLPSNRVNDMVQDEKGYVWLGTSNGLCRYDGYRFMNMLGVDGTAYNVGTMHLDKKNGLMWIRTATFSYACYSLQQGRFVDYYDKCDPNKTFERFITENDGIWMYEAHGGIRHVTYKEGQFSCRDYTHENGSLPKSKIKRLRSDGTGRVWALTDNGLLRTDARGEFRTVAKGGDFMIAGAWRDRCLFMTRDGRITAYDMQGRQVGTVKMPDDYGDMGKVNGNFVWQDKWMIMTRDAVICMDCKTMTLSRPQEWQMSHGMVLDEMDGNFWVADKEGTLRLFPKGGAMKAFHLIDGSAYNKARKRNFATIRGKDGRFYIATYGNGLFIYNAANGQAEHYSANDLHPIITSNYLTNIHEDRDRNIWVGQEEAGIVKISPSSLTGTALLLPNPAARGEKTNYITRLHREVDGSVTIGTKSTQVFRLTPLTGSISQAGTQAEDVGHNDSICDRYGRLWAATWESGLIMVDPANKPSTKYFLTSSISASRINALTMDKYGVLWIATYNGIYHVDTKQKSISDASFGHIGTNEGLASNDVICLLTTRDGSTWAGGIGTGLVKCRLDGRKAVITVIASKHGLASNNIHSMAEDAGGNVWAATDEAIACVNAQSMSPTNYQVGTTMLNNIYSDDCALTLNDGRILFGTHDGITVINPRERRTHTTKRTKAYITDIIINGTSIFSDRKYESLRTMSGDITLEHNENSLTLCMSSLDFSPTARTTYQFYLKGIDKDWREPTTQHSVDYGNLPPGTYTFCLRTEDGGEVTTLNITIMQPWYNTWWAWLMYIIIIGGIALTFLHHQQVQIRLRQQMAVEKQVAEFRAGFFTQVAHEFRTPLAIISSAVDKLNGDGSAQRKPIQTARRGVRRLTQLVNQLMEFRKINTGNLRLQVEQGDVIGFVRDIYQDFWNSAQQKEQNITFTAFGKRHDMYFDRHFLDVITYNLLSNAVKYTPQGGSIVVRLKEDEGYLVMTVEDSGTGIDEKRREQLFQPFMHGYASQGGMGIGLYTAYMMAQAHKGSLTYGQSETLGGAMFTLSIPNHEAFYKIDDYRQLNAVEHTEETDHQADSVIMEMMPRALNDIDIAIIEDDPDMLEQIKAEVGVYFHVTGYANGERGFEAMQKSAPSLLICDVMLPDASGYDIVKRMKGDDTLKDVPVIMLTALNDEQHQIKGYEAGADDYMVKPCNYRILIARAIQLIKWSEARKTQAPAVQPAAVPVAADSVDKAEGTTIITSQADKRFLEKVNAIVEQHIDDPDFSIDQMAELMKMGRTKLYGKVKEMTGMSPGKLFMKERMRMAAHLLDEGELNISEIGYRVGIPDASYFNKCFKQHFGVAPSKYRKGDG